MRVLVGGSHGMIGSALVDRLAERGDDVVRLVRGQAEEGELNWDSAMQDNDELEGFDAIVTLGGVGIGQKRWRTAEMKRIWDSRVNPTEQMAYRLQNVVLRPQVWVCASAVGFYGDRGDEKLTEESERGHGFLAELCVNWEDATKPAADSGIRVVNARSGIVLSKRGGAFAKQLPLFRLGMGGKLGSGAQFTSWITLHDEVEAIIHALANKKLSGPVNFTAPKPVTNVEFTSALGRTLNRPTLIPAWRWLLNLGFGRALTREALLASQRAVPRKLIASGFRFRDEQVEEAFARVLVDPPAADSDSDSEESEDVIDLDSGTRSTKRSKKKRKK